MKSRKSPQGAGTPKGALNGPRTDAVMYTVDSETASEVKSKCTQGENYSEESGRSADRIPTREGAAGGRPAWMENEGVEVFDPLSSSSSFINNCMELDAEGLTEQDSWVYSHEELKAVCKSMKSSDAKRAFTLAENIKGFIEKHGVEFIVFLTLTFPDVVTCAEAQKRFHSFRTNYLKPKFSEFVVVMEPHSGKYCEERRLVPHYHLLVKVDFDARTGVDFDAIKRGDYRTAPLALRNFWRDLREATPRYGLGRSEALPIKSTSEGVARYTGKYLSKSTCKRALDRLEKVNDWKGKRLIRYSENFPRTVGSRFGWVFGPGREFRALVAAVGGVLGAKSQDDLKRILGKRWPYMIFTAKGGAGRDAGVWEIAEMALLLARCNNKERETNEQSNER